MNRTPVSLTPERPLRLRASVKADDDILVALLGCFVLEAVTVSGSWSVAVSGFVLAGSSNSSPVMNLADLRIVALRHNSVRDTRQTLECHVSTTVPNVNATLFVVIIRKGGNVKAIQTGVMATIRTNKVVSAGLVVALVAVRCVERKSVIWSKGSRRILHRVVKTLTVSTISSNVF